MDRLARILDAAVDLAMAPIVGYFYFGQDQRLVDEASVIHATENATDWLLERGYANVLVEIGNEVDNEKYDHAILKADRCHELIELVKARSATKVATPAGRLLVSASLCGGVVPPENIVRASDYLLLHGNGVRSRRIGDGRPRGAQRATTDSRSFSMRMITLTSMLKTTTCWLRWTAMPVGGTLTIG